MTRSNTPSLFVRITDAVSFGMGTPANIIFWVIVVSVWFGVFAFGIVHADTNILPAWFVSNAFNFPLNSLTTLAELYIGFLVAAAANRNERVNREMINRIRDLLVQSDLMLKEIQGTQTQELTEEGEILSIEHTAAETADAVRTILMKTKDGLDLNTDLTTAIHTLLLESHHLTSEIYTHTMVKDLPPFPAAP